MSTKATAARIYEYGEPDVFRFETMDVPTVLYHAAAGGVGQIFTQWARSLGIHVIGTVSTAEKAQIALQAGCTAVVNYSTEDFVERTFELTGGQGVKARLDRSLPTRPREQSGRCETRAS